MYQIVRVLPWVLEELDAVPLAPAQLLKARLAERLNPMTAARRCFFFMFSPRLMNPVPLIRRGRTRASHHAMARCVGAQTASRLHGMEIRGTD
jgi:hypothetical protein